MVLLAIVLSYLIGCLSIIILLICLCICFGIYPRGSVREEEQYPPCRPLSDTDHSVNTSVETINYFLNILFQNLKDESDLRSYMMERLKIEFDELKATHLGRIFLRGFMIESFSLGKECPIFSNIRFERQERDERQLIKDFVMKIDGYYRDGFFCKLDVALIFGGQCQVYIKVKHIQGSLRVQFRREPFTHWFIVFEKEPLIDLEIKAYLFNRETPIVAAIIEQQIRRNIRYRHTWPHYKIRYPPFFSKSKQSLPIHIPNLNNETLMSGALNVSIKYCDRLSIPYDLFNTESQSLLSIFLTVNVNEYVCKDYLRLNRNQWMRQTIEFIPQMHRVTIKEVFYMDRIEFLIDEFDPIPDGINDVTLMRTALEDKNIFLFQIEDEEVKTLKQVNRLIGDKPKNNNGDKQKIIIIVGIPLLSSVRVQRLPQLDNSKRREGINGQLSTITQDVQNDQSISRNIQRQNSNKLKTISQQKDSSSDYVTLIMLNPDYLPDFQIRTPTEKAQSYVKFHHKFQFRINPNRQYLNICLWCKPPIGCDTVDGNKKVILLGYTTVALSDIILETKMSFRRETQRTINFQSAYTSKPNLKFYGTNSQSKRLALLTTHRNYDYNMANGFVTIHVQHRPDNTIKLSPDENDSETMSSKDDHVPSSLQPYTHLFEDYNSHDTMLCACCNQVIETKTSRRCRHCSIIVHHKCEDIAIDEHTCNDGYDEANDVGPEQENSSITNDEVDSIPHTDQSPTTTTTTTTTTAKPKPKQSRLSIALSSISALSIFDSSPARPVLASENKVSNFATNSIQSKDELPENSLTNSSSDNEKHNLSRQPVHKSSNLLHAAYDKLASLKRRRAPPVLTSKTYRMRLPSHFKQENISEDDLQDIITQCLSDERIDTKSFEHLIHEKAVDHTVLYAKANQLGAELYSDLPIEERRQKIESEILRLQQEIDLQDQIRDEMILEYNNEQTDEITKRNIRSRINNIDEKVQALAALTILYCSGLKCCNSQ